jgi:hypothetical protein
MTRLFQTLKIESFFVEFEKTIANEIDSYSEPDILSLNIDNTVVNLLRKFKLTIPSLNKDAISNHIIEKMVDGHQLPSGTRFRPGAKYPIEIVNYTVPFQGDLRFFEYIPTTYGGAIVDAEIQGKQLIIPLTLFCKVTGNDAIIEQISKDLVRKIENIELNLNYLTNDVQRYIPVLESKLRSVIDQKIRHVKLKKESSDKLNPFKK